jgi:branched-chain amino acid transport system permease protein
MALAGVPLALLAVVAESSFAPADRRVVVNFLIAVVLVLAIQTFSGNSGIVTFGHVAFMGVGAYVAALVTIPPAIKAGSLPDLPGVVADARLGFLPAVAVAAAVTAAVAFVAGLALTRMEENAMAMATIGVLVIAFVVFESWDGVTRGAQGCSACRPRPRRGGRSSSPSGRSAWPAVPREPVGADAAREP